MNVYKDLIRKDNLDMLKKFNKDICLKEIIIDHEERLKALEDELDKRIEELTRDIIKEELEKLMER